MEIKAFKDSNRDELSMIEVAHAILEERGDVMDFSDLVNQIQNYLGKADSDIRGALSQFYTDLNIDGSFISLGDNQWGLRSWYPFDSIDEEVSHSGDEEEDEEVLRRKKRKKVNAFIGNDEDAIDYNDDDPEDADIDEEEDDDLYSDDDDDEEIAEYDSELSEFDGDDISDDEEIIPGSVEEELTIIDDDDDDLFSDEEEEEE